MKYQSDNLPLTSTRRFIFSSSLSMPASKQEPTTWSARSENRLCWLYLKNNMEVTRLPPSRMTLAQDQNTLSVRGLVAEQSAGRSAQSRTYEDARRWKMNSARRKPRNSAFGSRRKARREAEEGPPRR